MNDRILVLGLVFGSLLVIAGVIVNVTLATIARVRRAPRQLTDPQIDARLDRIEAAVEAIAIEVERQGELQRFAAKVEAQRMPAMRAIERPVTPH